MAKGIRALLDTVMQALPQVGNLGLLFFLLFFIFAALGVELFGRLECSDDMPCQGLGEHAHFSNFGMAFLTLFRVATGDNWNGIMKDTLRDDCDEAADCVKNCCVSTIIAPIFFVIFVLMAQFVLVNVVVAVLMKHLEESHKQMEDELDMETQLERELAAEQAELLEVEEEEEEDETVKREKADEAGVEEDDDARERESILVTNEKISASRPGLAKVRSLPANFIYNPPRERNADDGTVSGSLSRRSSDHRSNSRPSKFKSKRRQTFHSGHHQRRSLLPMHFEVVEVFEKSTSNLSVPRIISQRNYGAASHDMNHTQRRRLQATSDVPDNKPAPHAERSAASSSPVTPADSVTALTCPKLNSERYLLPTASIHPSKATLSRRASTDAQSRSDTNVSVASNVGSNAARSSSSSVVNSYAENEPSRIVNGMEVSRTRNERRVSAPPTDDLDVQSIINERRPSKLKSGSSTGMPCGIADQRVDSTTRRVGSYGQVCTAEEKSEEVSPMMSTGNVSDSTMGSTTVNGSCSTSGSGSTIGSGSSSSSSGNDGSRPESAVVHIPEEICATVETDVRIYVDETDSTSSDGRRKRRQQNDETDPSTSISSMSPVREGIDETEVKTDDRSERVERSSSVCPSDPS